MKKYLLLLILPFLLLSCKKGIKQPVVLENNSGFDLEKVNFAENIPLLFSKHILNEIGTEYDSAYDGKFSDTILRYRLSNFITEALKYKIPEKEFGYLYKSPTIDSLAKFQNIYFTNVYALTNTSKKPVAYYAEATFDDHNLRKKYIQEFIEKYGQPSYSYYISSDFNQCSYEWDLKDRTIQIETSFGWGSSISSEGKNKSGKYYRLDFLLLENKFKKQIYDVHTLELPDKIIYNGKVLNYKEITDNKLSRIKDVFLLNSTNEDYRKDEYGEHDINNAEKDE